MASGKFSSKHQDAVSGSSATLYSAFINFIKDEQLFHQKDRLLLAVSGGLDSAVLCELCRQAGFNFAIAHCNFLLRGEESDADENFVRNLAQHYGVPFFVQRFETSNIAEEKKLSIQVAARELRYAWFSSLLSDRTNALAYILTAHHADDNMETILMNFFKGTGINGLKGILPRQGKIVRPLLFSRQQQLQAFAEANHLKWREDSSNATDKYSRNYFRHHVIPGIVKIFPEAEDNLLQNAGRVRDINTIYNNAFDHIKKKLLVRKEKHVEIPVLKLSKTPALTTVIYEIFRDYNFTAHQVPEIQKLLGATSGKYLQSPTHRVLRNRAWLIISALDNVETKPYVIEEKDAVTNYPGGELFIAGSAGTPKIVADANVAQLDARDIKFPLLLRKWKTGDYFYPLGMQKKKKLGRFFIDQKMSLFQKENTWVLESNKKIIWVLGLRIDDRFKITPSTTSVITCTLRPAK